MGSFILEVLLIAVLVCLIAAATNRPPPPCKLHTWQRVEKYNFVCTVCGKKV